MICGPQGVGKTTVAQRLALLRAGIIGGDLLGMPVEVSPGRVLYIAADRPRQIGRSFQRMVSEAEREPLATALVVWKGPPPFNLGRAEPGQLVELIHNFPEVDTVFIDSLKDVATKLADDETGGIVNVEHQRLIADGVELVVLHHQRKASGDNKKPKKLDDVYGSTFVTGGCGSVILLWGEAGDPIVELSHLKQPAGEFGPVKVSHDHTRGRVEIHEPIDLIDLAFESGGISAPDAARRIFEGATPRPAEVEKIRRRLERLADQGKIERAKKGVGKTAEIIYRGAGI
jgi:replicative DNA helicase